MPGKYWRMSEEIVASLVRAKALPYVQGPVGTSKLLVTGGVIGCGTWKVQTKAFFAKELNFKRRVCNPLTQRRPMSRYDEIPIYITNVIQDNSRQRCPAVFTWPGRLVPERRRMPNTQFLPRPTTDFFCRYHAARQHAQNSSLLLDCSILRQDVFLTPNMQIWPLSRITQ
jgi:hypothetical protein